MKKYYADMADVRDEAGLCDDEFFLAADAQARIEALEKSLDEVTEVLAANDHGEGAGWFAPCIGRARKLLSTRNATEATR